MATVNGIFVLGPSGWLDAERVSSRIGDRPKLVRENLTKMLGKFGLNAIMMEDHAAKPKETNTALFTRLIQEHHVEAFLVYWPLGAKLLGAEKEFGDLLRWLHDGILDPSQVFLLVEKPVLDDDGHGTTALNEKGNRTRYHDDFAAYEVRIRAWDDGDALAGHTVAVAWEVEGRPATKWYASLSHEIKTAAYASRKPEPLG